jgi:hypothetical protein
MVFIRKWPPRSIVVRRLTTCSGDKQNCCHHNRKGFTVVLTTGVNKSRRRIYSNYQTETRNLKLGENRKRLLGYAWGMDVRYVRGFGFCNVGQYINRIRNHVQSSLEKKSHTCSESLSVLCLTTRCLKKNENMRPQKRHVTMQRHLIQ